ERGRDLHHAAFAAMVCGARGDRHLLWLGLEALWRFSPGADGSQTAARFCCLFPPGGGSTLGRALHPRAFPLAGQEFLPDPFPETYGPAAVSRLWTSTRAPPGRRELPIAVHITPPLKHAALRCDSPPPHQAESPAEYRNQRAILVD